MDHELDTYLDKMYMKRVDDWFRYDYELDKSWIKLIKERLEPDKN